MLKKAYQLFFQESKKALFLILVGTFTWSLTMVKSGLIYPFGMGFWGPNGHDGVWHLSVIKALSRESFEMPVFAGEAIKNYHLGFDLLVAFLHKITFIPAHTLYFQIIPPILAFLVGVLTFRFVFSWVKSKTKSLWATFFVYFGGNFGWIITLFRSGEIGGESMFWSQQAISSLINPPFALSLIILLLALLLVSRHKGKASFKKLLLPAILFGILIQIKAYAGLLALSGLFAVGIWQIYKRKGKLFIKLFSFSFLVSLVIFLPFIKNAGGLIEYKPFWFLETMMGFSDRLNWPRFYSAMTNYRLGGQLFKGVLAYLVAFFIFWYGNMGTRLIQEIGIAKWLVKKRIDAMKIFMFAVILAGAIVPMFFLQKGTPWNTIQFFYYSLFFSGILAGITMGEILEKIPHKANLVGAAVVVLTLPTTFGTLRHYLPSRPPAKISNEELEALRFLENEESGVVLTYPFDADLAKEAEANPPRPLYLYESTAYVSAFSNKPTYLEDQVNLDITGFDWLERRRELTLFLAEQERDFLEKNNISYIYYIKGQEPLLNEEKLNLANIFENTEVTIFKVE